MILMFFMSGAVSAMENEITTKEWSNDKLLVKASIATTNKDISKGLFFNLDITNKSSEAFGIVYVKGEKPDTFLGYNFKNLTKKSDVEYNEETKNYKRPIWLKLDFLFIKPNTTHSFKVNLLDSFIVEKKQSYSLGITGRLFTNFIDNDSYCRFTIEDLTFTVE